MASLLAPTSTRAWAPPGLAGRTMEAGRLVEPLARSVDELLDLAPLPVFGPSGDARLRTERLWGWFVEPSVGGWSELPPELFGQARLARDPIVARGDIESIALEPWGAEDTGGQVWASARSADRSGRGAGRMALRNEWLDVRLAAFGEGGDGLLRVRRPTDQSVDDEDTDARSFRDVRAGGLARVRVGDVRTGVELLGAIDGREDRDAAEVGPNPFGPQDVVRHLLGIGLSHEGQHRLALRASRQGASYRLPGTDRVDPVLYGWEADGALRLEGWSLGLEHLGSAGRGPSEQAVLRLEGGPRLRWTDEAWRLELELGGLLHEVDDESTQGWTGAASLSWGHSLRVGVEVRKGINGLAALGRPSLVPDADQRSVRAAALLGWTHERGGLRLRAGPLVLEPQAAPAAAADLRLDGGVRLFADVSLHGALGWISRFPRDLRGAPGRADLLQDGIFVRSSLRWDPKGGVLEAHVVGRGASSGADNDFVRVGGFAGVDFGRDFWLRIGIENALDQELPETFVGEPAGIDLSVALSWEGS